MQIFVGAIWPSETQFDLRTSRDYVSCSAAGFGVLGYGILHGLGFCLRPAMWVAAIPIISWAEGSAELLHKGRRRSKEGPKRGFLQERVEDSWRLRVGH